MTARRMLLAGATATGKSAVALALAERRPGVEIVNADSRQVIAGLRVGTAAPSDAAMRAVPHHLYGIRAPGEEYTVAEWRRDAEVVLGEIGGRAGYAVITGGTGLYLEALLDGLETLPTPDPVVRRERNDRAATAEGLAQLVAELRALDPAAPDAIDARNPRRVIRALEIVEATGRPLSDSRTRGRPASLPEGTVIAGLDLEPRLLRERIERRARTMFDAGGIIDEVGAARATGIPDSSIAASGIGYAEAIAVIAGTMPVAAALDATVRRTLRYAKAQRTFFRRDPRITWFDAARSPEETAAEIAALGGW